MFYCGVDISSERIGISIVNELEEVLVSQTYRFYKETQKEKRMILKKFVLRLTKEFEIKKVYLESVRLMSTYKDKTGKTKTFISEKGIFRLVSLVVTLMNEDIEVYKVSPISWKTRILKWAGFDGGKESSINFVEKKYNLILNHDQADSICIALFAKRYEVDTELID